MTEVAELEEVCMWSYLGVLHFDRFGGVLFGGLVFSRNRKVGRK